jgi:hypothetical protein
MRRIAQNGTQNNSMILGCASNFAPRETSKSDAGAAGQSEKEATSREFLGTTLRPNGVAKWRANYGAS